MSQRGRGVRYCAARQISVKNQLNCAYRYLNVYRYDNMKQKKKNKQGSILNVDLSLTTNSTDSASI